MISDEIIYTAKDGCYLTQSPFKVAGKFTYRVYTPDGELIDSWVDEEDFGAYPISQFRKSRGYVQFSLIASKNTSSNVSAPVRIARPNKPVMKDYTKELNNSDTIVFHMEDPSTVMLKQVYEGRGFDVLTQRGLPDFQIGKLLTSHKRIICLGHGTPGGLIGANIGPSVAKCFKGKQVFAIWCNADKFFERYCPDVGPQFITGNIPSEAGESQWAGCGNISSKLMLENITYWSKLCAEALDECFEGNVESACENINIKYLEKYGNHPVSIYNANRTHAFGTHPILPDYEFKGKPLSVRDYPLPGFDEAEFLKRPVERADKCPVKGY